MTHTNKKYIYLFGVAACLYAFEVSSNESHGAYETHRKVCEKFILAFNPAKNNRYTIGRGLINAGRAIKNKANNFKEKYDLPK